MSAVLHDRIRLITVLGDEPAKAKLALAAQQATHFPTSHHFLYERLAGELPNEKHREEAAFFCEAR